MEGSSYNIEDVYKEIGTINDYFWETDEGVFRINTQHKSINDYCNNGSNSGFGKCNDYLEMTICSLIYLLKTLKENNTLEDDKLAEYAILWLSYKLDQKQKDKLTDLNKFYTDHIEKNKYYNEKIKDDDTTTYKKIIDKIKDLMDIKEISKFNDPFSILFYLYYVFHDESLNCKQNLDLANKFVQNVEKLIEDSNNTVDISYNKLLSTLSNDYNILINKYGNENKCPNFKSLSKIEPKKNPVEDSGQKFGETSEVISSSSSILNTVIPGLSIFAIPVFLGVAYKYSLFGFDKLFQRQYIRKKLKKVKKKMKLNI
ncbi:PIR protein [Plasmodium yoelii]|uniref:PIR protein n=2 Tax=Plasmodium yoelii TaxID=5861 RepID=A0AAE9WPN4_PLAYO|nr:PIR protein [Plasmodium yoelii]WBY56169.1 PIR protein [Plasmodium yoelii yoelii]VTZ76094.1 PIR protein [Plasmodium yoelii]|eukprot:XP_022810786.1 PIR protein [Plasmodium yoelii]